MRVLRNLSLIVLCGAAAGCSPDDETNEWGQPTLGSTDYDDSDAKADGVSGRVGLHISVDNSSTQVWEVRNRWGGQDAKAGIAWEADSGLTWDAKYRAWVDSLPKADCQAGCYGETFDIITPYGKTVPAPQLECAEMAMFMRIAFASWYHLPYFMEARSDGKRLYFGHFGIRTADGKWRNTPSYKTRYPDYEAQADAVRAGADWPSDPKLRARKIVGSFDDEQPFISEDAHAGAYFDEVFLNKRVGHYLMLHLVFLGSVNLADPSNMYNLAPASTQPGDVLVKRYGVEGIGHTIVLKSREDFPDKEVDGVMIPQFELQSASGSMPRRQPAWDSATSTKYALTADGAGGGDMAEFGGGIKRWRVTRNINNRWTNVVLAEDSDAFIRSSDFERIAARIDEFESYIVKLSPEEKLVALATMVDNERQWLEQHPSSCSARERRERAFQAMYELAPELGKTLADIDAEFRILDDYVFAELEYKESKTCCWNSSNSDMYDIVMDLNRGLIADATDFCPELVTFMGRDDEGDGFEIFRQFAEGTDRGEQWVAWSADESCPQADAAGDTPKNAEPEADICSLE